MGKARKVTVNDAMTAVADQIRIFGGITDKMDLDEMASNIGVVYNAGRDSGVSEGFSNGWMGGIDEGYTAGIEIGKAEGIELGKQAEKKAFWDSWQWDGTRTDYHQACRYWKFNSFRPEHDMYPTNAGSMFAFSNMPFSLIEELKQAGKVLDTSNATEIGGMFWGSKFTETPEIKAVKCANINNVYYNSSSMKKATLTIEAAITDTYAAFRGCNSLEDLTINGTIPCNVDFAWCSRLTTASVQSIIGSLKDLTGATAQKVSFAPAVLGKLTDEQYATIWAKNWTT